MKFRSRAQVEALSAFKSQGDLVTSLYLDTDKGRRSKKEILLDLKNLLTGARAQAAALDAAKDKVDSLIKDLDRMSDHCRRAVSAGNAPGLAVFSCSRRRFWQDLELPHGPRNRVLFDTNFYVRPLVAILDRFRPLTVLLVSHREARWYEVAMGEIQPVDSLRSDVPGRVREGGFEGTQAKKIERRLEGKILDHFKAVARRTFELHKKEPIERLFVSCEDNHAGDFEAQLHPYLRQRIQGRLKARPSDPAAKVLEEVLTVEAALTRAEEEETVRRLVAELERGGRATSGLRDTLHRINQFEVQTLVVTHNFAKPGRICPTHKFLYVDELKCPVCDKKTDIVQDVIDEAIEAVLGRSGTVKQITPPSKLDRYGHIGAFLKYKA